MPSLKVLLFDHELATIRSRHIIAQLDLGVAHERSDSLCVPLTCEEHSLYPKKKEAHMTKALSRALFVAVLHLLFSPLRP